MNCAVKSPFFDATFSNAQRIDWLLSAMSVEEKLSCLSSRMPDLPRLGIAGCGLGGEAAHGVEARNDQRGSGVPDISTSFVQPIGFSQSWDPALVEKAGAIVGTEARVINLRHPGRGLSRWAPTVDLERDPRWGRNEEGYGEDPVLTGEMAGAYVRGMQGNHPRYLRIAATLKHFYANNTEDGRGWKNSVVDPRNRSELYLEPFRRCIEKSGAMGIMTAYNRINGAVGILNPEVKNILKQQYGLVHAVGDGGALGLVTTLQHVTGSHAEALAQALKAGVDGMSDNPVMVEEAAHEAFRLGLITEADMDAAIRAKLEVALRLGLYDPAGSNPYAAVTEEDILTPESREICLQLSRESIVLLKNENDLLPLSPTLTDGEMALVGPLADAWHQDWYGGEPPCRITLRDGLKQLGKNPAFADGFDRITLKIGGQPMALNEEGRLCAASCGETFIREDWGEGCFTLRSENTGKYLAVRQHIPADDTPAFIGADRCAAFDWFVMERFFLGQREDGAPVLLTRFHDPVELDENGFAFASRKTSGHPIEIVIETDGAEQVKSLLYGKKRAILALGCHSMINAKEEIDRETLALPPHQQKLLETVIASGVPFTLVLLTNYPYDLSRAKEAAGAILMSATGAQDMGLAMAETLFGLSSPAGRLNMTWNRTAEELPSIDDYDIIKGGRTYRYFTGETVYPFGYGLTYSPMVYSDLRVQHMSGMLRVSFTVKNVGSVPSDEVAQLYFIPPKGRAKRPLRQLLGFERLKNLQPGESRPVNMEIPADELRYYDVVSRAFLIEEGNYRFFAGRSCMDEALCADVFIPGGKPGLRLMEDYLPADHYDDYENITLELGCHGFTAAAPAPGCAEGVLTYRDCGFTEENTVLCLRLISESGCEVEVYVDGEKAASWAGDTRTCEHRSAPVLDRLATAQVELRNRHRKPIYEDIELDLSQCASLQPGAALKLILRGDVKLCWLKMKKGQAVKKINLGVAN